MKLYYYASRTENSKLRGQQETIRTLLEQSGVTVISNLQPDDAAAMTALERAEEAGQNALEQIDALVVEGSASDPEVGYFLAFAISTKKPTLFLMEKGSTATNPLSYLAGKNVPSQVKVKRYSEKTLESAVYEMVGDFESSEFAETPTIKFTLRITPLIENYLHWKTHNTKITKADFLRKLILEEVIKKDEEFRKYRGRKDGS
ncbi:MAG: hypothetical protein Q8Q20_00490 [bacterium]|nr:hypothetical protein [bacterium]